MFQFPGFASLSLCIQPSDILPINPDPDCSGARLNSEDGFPHSEICGSKVAHTSPQLIAACHVLHRLCMPRHPPIALTSRLRIHTTIDSPACMTGADISVIWFEHHKTQMFVTRHGLGVRSDLSAR